MAFPNPQPNLSRAEPFCVVFGDERSNLELIDATGTQLGLPSARLFNADHWFNSQASSASQVTPVIILDASEGVGDQDRFYARLVKFLDLSAPVVLVANLDLIGFEQEQFELIQEEYRDFLSSINLQPSFLGPLPLGRPDLVPWWTETTSLSPAAGGPNDLLEETLRMKVISSTNEEGSWVIAGRMVSGTVKAGDEVVSSPSNQRGVVSTISEIEDGTLKLTFGTPVFAEPGEVVSHLDAPPVETDVFRVKALWSGDLRGQGDPVSITTAYGTVKGTIQSVEQILVPTTFKASSDASIDTNSLVEIILRTDQVVAIDHISNLPATAGLKLLDVADDTCLLAIGHVSMEGYADQRHLVTSKAINTTPIQFAVGENARAKRNGHEGGVLWFTGLSGSGKSTLAVALEARLFEKGYQVFVLDGDNVRQGLTSNLGFSPDDRAENIRRVGEVAALFRQAGVIVISSFISPYRSDRDRARHAAYSSFHEVYIKADIETCISRDPKGLYERAIKGDIPDFTGISAPYEAPTAPELVIDTGASSIEVCVDQLVNYVDRNFRV